ncbi:flippase [Natronolimnobius sp. AArcel1]|uniref:flippase n=1 Tax=Natronolimnobius sp. AArcel1 TaxID=1679093 RepID=UPI0013EDB1BA|nr:flippase [Natronolimnobius sp. AArcel1]NGM70322.1 flippase [Natronolimnobius sp. AArcel1]
MSLQTELGNRFKIELISRIAAICSGMILTVILARLLEPDGYGLLFFALSILGAAKMVSKLGLGKSTGRYVAKYNTSDRGQLRHILEFGLLANLATIALTCLGLFMFAAEIASLAGEPDLEPLLLVGVLFVLCGTLKTFVRKVLQGFEDIKTAALVKIVDASSKLLFVIALVVLGYEALGALLGYALSLGLAAALGGVIIYWRYYRSSPRAPREAGLRRRIGEYSIPITATSTANVLDKQVDTILIGFFLTPAAVGFYTVAKQVIESVEAPMASLGFTLAPTYEVQKEQGNTETAARIYEAALTNGLLVYVPAAAGLVLVAEPFVELVFGADYLEAVPVLQVFALYAVLLAITNITSNGLDYLGRARARAVAKGVTSVCNVGLNILLIPQYGVIGAAVATVITHSLYTLANLYIINQEFNLRVLYILRHSVGIVFVTLVMSVAVATIAGAIQGWLTLISVIAVGVFVWALSAVLTGLLDLQAVRSHLLA